MYRYIFIGFLVLANLSCQSPSAQTANNSVANKIDSISNSLENSDNSESVETEEKLVESFSDDKNVGVPHKNKVELLMFEDSKDNRVELKFYSLAKDKSWELKQTIKQIKYGSLSLDVQIKDFNNDGNKDITFVSSIAARGANEIRNLFVYDKKNDQLIYIKNSGDYPNLLYNKRLNCLDAQRFYGGTATDFLKIEGDVLKEFASVETFGTERKVYLIDKNDERKLLRTDKVPEDWILERYKTFNPPRVNTDIEN